MQWGSHLCTWSWPVYTQSGLKVYLSVSVCLVDSSLLIGLIRLNIQKSYTLAFHPLSLPLVSSLPFLSPSFPRQLMPVEPSPVGMNPPTRRPLMSPWWCPRTEWPSPTWYWTLPFQNTTLHSPSFRLENTWSHSKLCYLKSQKKFSEWKQVHVGMKPSKTSQTR